MSGIDAGNGGASSDLVLLSNSPVGEQDVTDFSTEMRMATARDSSRRNASLGDFSGGEHRPLGWWEEKPVPRIERPFWIYTSRSANTWVVPRRVEERREYEGYWGK